MRRNLPETIIVHQNLAVHLLQVIMHYRPVDRERAEGLTIAALHYDRCVGVVLVFTGKVDLGDQPRETNTRCVLTAMLGKCMSVKYEGCA
jgi:hypothetical protein